jgi:hypothetical protein
MRSATPFQHRATAVGLTEALVRRVIDAFYERVRRDAVLGPVFAEAIGDDWAPHIEKINQFWLTAPASVADTSQGGSCLHIGSTARFALISCHDGFNCFARPHTNIARQKLRPC